MKIDTFSKRLKEALRIRNIRQIELSEKTNIPKSAICQYLGGRFEPKQDRLSDIASVLEVSEAWLMGFDVPMHPDTEQSQIVKRTVYSYEGEDGLGTEEQIFDKTKAMPLNTLLKVAKRLSIEQINVLITVAENMSGDTTSKEQNK